MFPSDAFWWGFLSVACHCVRAKKKTVDIVKKRTELKSSIWVKFVRVNEVQFLFISASFSHSKLNHTYGLSPLRKASSFWNKKKKYKINFFFFFKFCATISRQTIPIRTDGTRCCCFLGERVNRNEHKSMSSSKTKYFNLKMRIRWTAVRLCESK